MSAQMTVRSVRLVSAERSYEFEFGAGVNLVVGPVGVGKTSLLELIRYGLGGSAQLSPVVKEVGRTLALSVDVGAESYLLTREIQTRTNTIAVHQPDGAPMTKVTTARPAEDGSISRLLMTALGIPQVQVPTSRRKPAGRYTTVSYNDVYAYQYLPQSEIDRSTANHLDPIRDPKRKSTFEVLYGLIDAEIANTQVELGRLATEISEARQALSEIEAFVNSLELPETDQLEEQAKTIAARIEARERELAEVRKTMRDARGAASNAQRSADQLAVQVADALSRRDRAGEQVHDLERLRAQLVLDEQRTVRSMLAGTELAAIEFYVCPRCLQSVTERERTPGTCLLCTQPEPAAAEITLEDEARRLEGQLAETDGMISEANALLTASAADTEALQRKLADARAQADAEAQTAVAPFVDRVAALAEEVGSLRGDQANTTRSLQTRQKLAAREQALRKLEAEQRRLSERLEQAQSAREEGLERIGEVSEAFDEILRQFQLPWYEPSHIDSVTYLPLVGGKKLEELSSGGMKTLVNNAYYLAGLTYALRAPTQTHLPRFLIIDSPRKNFGSDEDDAGAAVRIYDWIRRLQDSYLKGAERVPFQLIIADNDVPAVAKEFSEIRLSYESPLIDDLQHPGPDLVETLQPTA